MDGVFVRDKMYMTDKNGTNGEGNIKVYYIYF